MESPGKRFGAATTVNVQLPLGIDIGGTMCKIMFFRPVDPPQLPDYVIKEPDELGALPIARCEALMEQLRELSGALRFMKIPSKRVPDFVDFLLSSGLAKKFLGSSKHLMLTGGGAHKYAKLIEEKMGVRVVKMEEMKMLVDGVNFFIKNNVYEEVFSFDAESRTFLSHLDESFFPFLLVNIGSGVSILRVDGYGRAERVSGTSVGGGTFWGLCRLLTKVKTFAEVEKLSTIGVNGNVDLLVSDIYGPNGFEVLGLAGDVIASSFGKIGSVRHVENPAEPSEYEEADIVRSLLFMITNNVTQISYLNAERHGVKRVIFAGGFLQQNPYVWSKLTYGIKFWSRGAMQALFLQHDGYLGAIGTFVGEYREPSHEGM